MLGYCTCLWSITYLASSVARWQLTVTENGKLWCGISTYQRLVGKFPTILYGKNALICSTSYAERMRTEMNLVMSDVNWILENNETNGLVARRRRQRAFVCPILRRVVYTVNTAAIRSPPPWLNDDTHRLYSLYSYLLASIILHNARWSKKVSHSQLLNNIIKIRQRS